MTLRILFPLLPVFILSGFLACSAPAGPEGAPVGNPVWLAVDLRSELTVAEAWQKVLDKIEEEYTLDILTSEDGYIQTKWLRIDRGSEPVQTRLSAIVRPNARRLEVIGEASYLKNESWAPMDDVTVFNEIFKDICILVGR